MKIDSEFAYDVLENASLSHSVMYGYGRDVRTGDPAFDQLWAETYDRLMQLEGILRPIADRLEEDT